MSGELFFAAKGLIVKGAKFLALKRTDSNGEKWEIPGGRMEFGESLTDTLVREVKEETSLDVRPERLIAHWDLIGKARQISGVVFLCRIESGEVSLSQEHSEYAWFGTADADRLYPAFAKIINELEPGVLE